MRDIGKVALRDRGTFNASVSYEILDVVEYQGYVYCCFTPDTPTGTLPTDSTHFHKWFGTASAENVYQTNDSVENAIDDSDYIPFLDSSAEAPKRTLWSNLKSKILASPVFTGSISLGRKANTTVGTNSVALGNNNEASGNYSHAEGYSTASANYSHAEGYGTTASANNSHAEGHQTTASNSHAHAEGNTTNSSGGASHAEGYGTTASGQESHAEGNRTTASGPHSHAEGYHTTASADNAHAEGRDTIAKAMYSHVEGDGTIANEYCRAQHVEGKYNIEDTQNKYAHIIGNGTADNSRSNAFTVDWYGKVEAQGDVVANKDSATPISMSALNASLTQISSRLNIKVGTVMNTAQGYATLNIPAFKVIGANVSNWNGTYVRIATPSSTNQCILQPRLTSNDAPIGDTRIQIYYYYVD